VVLLLLQGATNSKLHFTHDENNVIVLEKENSQPHHIQQKCPGLGVEIS
jgi:hypothetical protein